MKLKEGLMFKYTTYIDMNKEFIHSFFTEIFYVHLNFYTHAHTHIININ